jgi:glutamate synthase (ferredoxin)
MVWNLIRRHQEYTQSGRAAWVLKNRETLTGKFVKVIPKDYKRMLQCFKKVQEQGLSGDEASMAAFEANMRDVARVGGG